MLPILLIGNTAFNTDTTYLYVVQYKIILGAGRKLTTWNFILPNKYVYVTFTRNSIIRHFTKPDHKSEQLFER